ncbi:vitamin B12-dependent ribonucleotide reductase [Anaerofustis stercorihominis]|uniref:vitamin B12-dependent ribonucleotide reductase n=1 Tax=Anaerofustis stercorihominis TaxID=214853 RepID=UPI00210CFD60|nr:vitamin B12-dependent ribonucleotide reductase [Anaerofustis stercorihominis]MCQ4794433.1 vitamin B12-dependent ribonucleotide reductase [Anaerofustis stercorihominis]
MDNLSINNIFTRRFTKELEREPNKTVFDLFEYKRVDVEIFDYKTNKNIFEMKDLEFPEFYSKNACNIIASKYFRRAGVGSADGHETSMKQVADRMVGFWADALVDEGLIRTKEQYSIFYDELVYALINQMWAPNSPQWFNTGIKRNYGIAGESDHLYYYDIKSGTVKESKDRYTRTQASACFILSIKDTLLGDNSISEQYITETKLFKGGSGVGTNFSNLRAINEVLSSGGKSSGLMSFLKGFDRNAGAIKSGGTTRRAAKMVITDIDHPEIEDFITWKAREEDKVRALGKMGYDMSMDGEAYATVSGQNGNNSVRLNKEFMQKVLHLDEDPDADFELKGRVDDKVNRKVKVKELWDLICQSTWNCADPAVQFDDTFNDWHTCPAGEDGKVGAKHNRINATNPCSEYAFLDNTACNLASINIYRFFSKEEGKFKLNDYIHLISLIQLVLEASIHWGQFPTKEVARKSHLFRTTGLGLANMASLLMVLGYPYDSDEGRNLSASLCSIMTAQSYLVSSLMAKEVGPFAKYDINKEHLLKVLRNSARCSLAIDDNFEGLDYSPVRLDEDLMTEMGLEEVLNAGKILWIKAIEGANRYGVRNAQVSVIAPTGTISFAMDCGATSLEPFYSNVVYKSLAGGGMMELVNPVLEDALINLGYSDEQVDKIKDYLLEKDENGMFVHFNLNDAPYLREEDKKIFETANDISPSGHVLMVAAVTPMISGSVSKTVNMPVNATVKEISDIYKLSYITGVKAISVYRDGSKACQPLNTALTEDSDSLENLTYDALLDYARNCKKGSLHRVKPDGMRTSRTHAAKIGDIELYVTIGFYKNGKMSELFVSTDKEGTVVKGLLASLSKSISNMLQYNIPAKEISRLLRGQQFEPSGFVSRHPYIKNAASIADLLSKIIDIELGDYSRVQIKPTDMEEKLYSGSIKTSEEKAEAKNVTYDEIKDDPDTERVYGEVCPVCSSTQLFTNGTCKVCRECGSTTGCS